MWISVWSLSSCDDKNQKHEKLWFVEAHLVVLNLVLEPIASVCVCVCVCVHCHLVLLVCVSRIQMTEIQDWYLFHDMLLHEVNSQQEYQLYGFLPFLSVASHFLFSSSSSPHVRYPYSHFEVFYHVGFFTMLYSFISDGLLSCIENYKLVVECACGVMTRTQHTLKPAILWSLKSIILSFDTAISSSLNAVPSTRFFAFKVYQFFTGTSY